MPNKTRPYREALLEALSDPREAVHYLNAAINDSPEMFLKALRNVAQARQMAKVARDAGVTRESLYRATSETGNPTLDTLESVLSAMGININFVVAESNAAEGGSGGSLTKLQTTVTVPQSANLVTSGSLVGSYDSGTALGTNASSKYLDLCVIMSESQDPLLSAASLQAKRSLPNANLGEKIDCFPGFFYQQQIRQVENVNE